MNLFNYLMAKKGHNTSPRDDLFAYLLGKVSKVVKEATGATIHITDVTREKIISLWLDKESTQEVTQGYNILPYAPAETKTQNGITIISDGKGTYTINGTASSNTGIQFDLNEEFTIPISCGQSGNGKMYLFNNYTGECSIAFIYDNEQIDYWMLNSENRISNSYSSMGNKLCNKINLYFIQGQTITNGKISPMFTNDGDTTHDFEPYTGGQPSPSPDYPQEVKVVEGYIEDSNNYVDVTVEDGNGNSNVVSIPLNGNFIGGIGNYKDELMVDKNGKCYLNKVITKIDSYNGETITTEYMSTTGGLDIGATIYYVTAPQLIDLNYTVDLKLFIGENNISNSEDMMMTLKYY